MGLADAMLLWDGEGAVMDLVIGRWLTILASLGVAYVLAFRNTPELDGIENATFYRFAYAMVIMRGVAFLVFDSWGLFKL